MTGKFLFNELKTGSDGEVIFVTFPVTPVTRLISSTKSPATRCTAGHSFGAMKMGATFPDVTKGIDPGVDVVETQFDEVDNACMDTASETRTAKEGRGRMANKTGLVDRSHCSWLFKWRAY